MQILDQITRFSDGFTIVLRNALESHMAGAPAKLREAVSYAVLNGGKRLRPFLVAETAALFGRQGGGVTCVGTALECIHSYSLVHDDLPAMDNDDLRRGKPTTHKQYDEATAILVGDALQALAYEMMADDAIHADPAIRLLLMRELAAASGARGMVGGQWLDMAAEGRFAGVAPPSGEAEIRNLQAMKTGALLEFACVAGARLADATPHDITVMTRFGEIVGQAFQLADDVLDRTSDAATLGKAVGKDADAGKATLVDLWGLETAQIYLADLVSEANALLEPYGPKADTLRALAVFIAQRKS